MYGEDEAYQSGTVSDAAGNYFLGSRAGEWSVGVDEDVLASQGYVRLMRWALAVPLKDPETGYKFFKRERVLALLDQVQSEGWFWDTEIMVRSLLAGLTIRELPCLFVRRYDKASSVRLLPDSLEYARNLWRFRGVVRELRAGGDPSVVPADTHGQLQRD